jgi:TetR/AcrR family transcriptional repressor of mexJK operon
LSDQEAAMTEREAERPQWLSPLNDPRNEAILTAAFELFVQKGLSGTTMSEVAAQARVSKETLYDRFDSKEGLLYALLAWAARERSWESELGDAALADDPLQGLHAAVLGALTIMLREEAMALYRVMIGEARRMPDVAAVYEEFTCGFGRSNAHKIATALAARDLIRSSDVDEFVNVYMSLVCGELHRQTAFGLRAPPEAEEIKAWAETVTRRLLKAFSPA